MLTHSAAAVAGLVLGAGATGSDADRRTPAQPAETVTATATATATVTATTTAKPVAQPSPTGPLREFPGDGTFLVGQDIQPGTYRTTGPQDDELPNCYWARLRNTSGGLSGIIANDNAQGQAVVTITPTDKAFQTNGCQTWKKVG
ncbi:hypothetical protein [Streptomyces sp. AP-93]|uniref:hypothetical protein n=1 Tax=Streptomyces sp. AP-93 TaxID=2929048 RepID=UPI001FAF0FD7|nr:hypothetical protein [Streptomyces sp. AP-93]MCJ0872079.1 hypothetical protein [Streptomyces sp. AP-93]